MAIPMRPDHELPELSEFVGARIAPLASLRYQERYVIGGTREEYVLAGDLLDDVTALRHRFARPETRSTLTTGQVAALEALLDYIDAHGDQAVPEQVSIEELEPLLRDGPVWTRLRRLAAETLREFGMDVGDMSAATIAALSDR